MYANDFRRMGREALRGKWKKTVMLLLLAAFLAGGLLIDDLAELFYGHVEIFYYNFEGMTVPIPYVQVVGFGRVLMLLCALLRLFMMPMFSAGGYALAQDALDGKEPVLHRLFPVKLVWKLLGMYLLRLLLIFLWSLLFVIPGIVAVYRYSMAEYLLLNHPEMGPVQALRRSRELMMGNKGRAFGLDFSFIGWLLLTYAASYALGWLFSVSGIDSLSGYFVISALAVYLISAPVQAYRNTARVAFYATVEHAGDFAGATADEQATQEQEARRAAEEEARKRDEDVRRAHEMFLMYHCSRRTIEKAGLTEQYLQLLSGNAYPEEQWKRDYVSTLMQRFDGDPSALDDIIALADEYGMDDLADRALGRIDRHIYQQTLPDPEILNLLGRMLTLLQSQSFAEQTGFVMRKRQQILGMATRLEQRLNADDPDGSWKDMLHVVKEMAQAS